MPTFFFLSGLLVAQSLDKSPSRRNFAWKRFLRLYPAATAAVLITALVIGPLVTTLPLKTYFTHPVFFQYLLTIFLVQIFFRLPGVFEHSTLSWAVNSSLWSLALEWKCYAGLLLFSFIKNPRLRPPVLLATLLLLITGIVSGFVPHAYKLAAVFLIGNLCYYFRKKIIIRPWWPAAILLLGLAAARLHLFAYALILLIPALILYLAVNGTRIARHITPRPDLSYGLYVWAFPIEQLIYNYIHPNSLTLLFLLTLLGTLPLAILSWYFIELPALKLKRPSSPDGLLKTKKGRPVN